MPDPVEPTPVVVPAAAPAATEAPAASAPVVETTSAPVATPEAPVAEPTLLEKFDAEAKAAEAAKAPKPPEPAKEPSKEAAPADPAKADEEAPKVPEPAPLAPVEYKYTLPETLKMDDALKGEVHSAFDAFRSNPAEGAQKLIDLHAKTMQDYAEQLSRDQYRIFNETRAEWQKQVMADPEIGGAGYRTSMGAIARVRDVLVPEADRAGFDEFLRVTGAGDNLYLLKMLHRAARYIDEAPQPPPNPKPPTNLGQKPTRGLRDVYKS